MAKPANLKKPAQRRSVRRARRDEYAHFIGILLAAEHLHGWYRSEAPFDFVHGGFAFGVFQPRCADETIQPGLGRWIDGEAWHGYPLSLRNVEDLLFERGIDICHETVRLWWNRFGPLFAADIRRRRVSRMRGFR